MTTATRQPAAPAAPAAPARRTGLAPGVAACGAAAAVAFGLAHLVPALSPLLVAIFLGTAVAAVAAPGPRLLPGLAYGSRTLLRAGIVLLGLQVSLRQIADLGPRTLVLIVVVVASGIAFTLAVGRALGVSWTQRVLIACGFSICGAAAIAAVDGAIDADEEETATAIALVVVFGTLMIGVLPVAALLLNLDDRTAGTWAGASIHEVAQVVAAGGLVGSGALTVAIVVKLGRVLMLAPVVAWVTWQQRRRLRANRTVTTLPPLVPGFIAGFVVMVLVRTWAAPPELVLELAKNAETLLLAAAMFALGCGVQVRVLRAAGWAPMLLAGAATAWVTVVGLVGAVLIH
ncbi:putative sulfate exporter family transporter [Nocardioides marmoriginsengisoli]|uniref:Putative sulfate exporter family transporter n=1 Tax=Nocardioides marmoriginsengisoli TaxID=661483 RepID=A0A3N0CCM1_9ACTN|nr:putative sulfate exporter family transporter [Nocardioides marmoriginsengisoli]RNL60796.1 putative sulfate exporter family transporter [Nocardioides marmoriginsengisoli]